MRFFKKSPFLALLVNSFLLLTFIRLPALSAQWRADWLKLETSHFVIIYRHNHAAVIPDILNSAESALSVLTELFKHTPSEKIVINTNDFSDFGSAGATTVPHNFIRLEIEPLEPGYENMPHNARIRWLIAHELVHVLVNDIHHTGESFTRSLFSKVPPEKNHPLSIFYSLLTNANRYSPRWHQEGIAVFMETWLSGGFGRLLSSFDEMYFRSLILEESDFYGPVALDATGRETSFLLETLSYLYGARFNAFLAAKYGPDKLLAWYRDPGGLLEGFEGKFKNQFRSDLQVAWKEFASLERAFQNENLSRLRAAPLTPATNVSEESLGWVTQPYLEHAGESVLFGSHQAHSLTSINRLDPRTGRKEKLGSLPTPSIIQIASTAYDRKRNLFFYTTNNNRLYRDIWVMDLTTGRKRQLFKDARVGELTVSSETRELWGVRHSGGRSHLVHSPYPYKELRTQVVFDLGDDLHHLAISPSGTLLAATLHQASGRQALIVSEVQALKKSGRFQFRTLTEQGSPEFPSWSPDESTLYWNAFTNGVSNIYRYQHDSGQIEALSHTLRGFFRPLHISSDSLFAFEFSTRGFIPVLLPNQPAVRLPATHYYGQKIVEQWPQVTQWSVKEVAEAGSSKADFTDGPTPQRYSGLASLQFHSAFPVITGFRDERVIGLYSHLADPLFTHDLVLEFGASPFDRAPGGESVHLKARYEYKRKYRLELEHNAPNFFDLVNERKVGTNGTKIALGHTHYWKFDQPHSIKQTTDLTFYTGIETINDNLIPVNFPDFFIFETSTNSRKIRRAIGSVDSESGYDWTLSFLGVGTRFRDLQAAGGVYGACSRFITWAWPHNVLHLKLAAGYLSNPQDLAIGRFYFGAFGNQTLEDEPVKQYREPFRFPGVPVYSLAGERFGKIMLEHNLPPLRFGNVGVSQHLLTRIDASWFTQALLVNSGGEDKWTNLGAQINFRFKHWFNLETTLSVGAARAWSWHGGTDNEWFISFKLFRD